MIRSPFHQRNLKEMYTLYKEAQRFLKTMLMIVNCQVLDICFEGAPDYIKQEAYKKFAYEDPQASMRCVEEYFTNSGVPLLIKAVRLLNDIITCFCQAHDHLNFWEFCSDEEVVDRYETREQRLKSIARCDINIKETEKISLLYDGYREHCMLARTMMEIEVSIQRLMLRESDDSMTSSNTLSEILISLEGCWEVQLFTDIAMTQMDLKHDVLCNISQDNFQHTDLLDKESSLSFEELTLRCTIIKNLRSQAAVETESHIHQEKISPRTCSSLKETSLNEYF